MNVVRDHAAAKPRKDPISCNHLSKKAGDLWNLRPPVAFTRHTNLEFKDVTERLPVS